MHANAQAHKHTHTQSLFSVKYCQFILQVKKVKIKLLYSAEICGVFGYWSKNKGWGRQAYQLASVHYGSECKVSTVFIVHTKLYYNFRSVLRSQFSVKAIFSTIGSKLYWREDCLKFVFFLFHPASNRSNDQYEMPIHFINRQFRKETGRINDGIKFFTVSTFHVRMLII